MWGNILEVVGMGIIIIIIVYYARSRTEINTHKNIKQHE